VAGEQLTKGGYKHALCVVQAQGQVQLEDRCAGIKQKFSGTTDEIFANGTDKSAYTSTIKAKLAGDPSIDAVVTLGPALGVAVANDLKSSGTKVAVATYAMNDDVYPLLASGDLIFTIDQQPWLQGYMSIDSLWFYKKNGTIWAPTSPSPPVSGPRQVECRAGTEIRRGRRPLTNSYQPDRRHSTPVGPFAQPAGAFDGVNVSSGFSSLAGTTKTGSRRRANLILSGLRHRICAVNTDRPPAPCGRFGVASRTPDPG
jgi:hypothetical protein